MATTATEDARSDVLRAAATLADRSVREEVAPFLESYYRDVLTDDLLQRRPEDVLGAALSHRELATQRRPGEPAIRVFTPTVEEHGWSVGSTIVEIVTDDMPFLVDSVTAELTRLGRTVRMVVHPQLVVRRDEDGRLTEVLTAGSGHGAGTLTESWMHVEIGREPDADGRAAVAEALVKILRDVRAAVQDWDAMRAQVARIVDRLESDPPGVVDAAEVSRVVSLLRWLADGQFTFLGYREYRLRDDDVLEPVAGTGLGILAAEDPARRKGVRLRGKSAAKAREPQLLIITKANSRATVHRPSYLDYVSVKTFADDGTVVGEQRFLGLLTATAYVSSVTQVPYVREKVQAVLDAAGYAPESHLAKDLLAVLEAYPRDELFQADVATLTRAGKAVVHLRERPRTRVFLREDDYGRFMSCIVYLPRDRYTTASRLRMASLLKEAFHGVGVDHNALVSESILAQLHFVVRVAPGQDIPDVDLEDLERRLAETTRSWEEDLAELVRLEHGEERGARLLVRYGAGFSEAYKETFHPRVGVADIGHAEHVAPGSPGLSLYHLPGAPAAERRLKLYSAEAVALTEILPVLTDLGVVVTDERPYELGRDDGTTVHIYDFGLRAPDPRHWAREGSTAGFQEAVEAVWSGRAETGGLNALVLTAGLTWRQVVVLRTISSYVRQTGVPHSREYVQEALRANPDVAVLLVELFETRLHPDRFGGTEVTAERRAAEEDLAARITARLEEVASLDHDRILRAYLAVVRATERTSYYRDRETVALKLAPRRVPGLPAPRPAHEIWVYGPRVEGVHLRFGKVARGGLRWTDRREDFRTEILGLVKAQTVKNAVIVPTGAKGGFLPKRLPDPAADRDAWLAEAQAAYRLFIASLLDVTDNRVDGAVSPPERVVRHDDDDPYLVVAADKGTAGFSDVANTVAAEYGFWLGDAFASGGSAGYNHKAMGITARGAWESVKRHFRELGADVQAEDFTVVGVGDMGGDVFGNGMLLSEHIRLVAAFDHRHVFLDPDPDAAVSYAERRRLFELPRSTWADYDRARISEGGGVYPRTAKSVPLSPQVRARLGLGADVTALTPADLIRAILRAPVDLLWNGGVGTYVKASTETHAEIGDRANDAVRVDAAELRVKVVGEGGNLGLSQLGRIEAAKRGILVNTDAIDNSAGVDTSDHEVNIKILLGGLVAAEELTVRQRDRELAAMTDDVAAMVLRDTYEQNVLLSNARVQARQMLAAHRRFMRWLEERGILDRRLEFLPSEEELGERADTGQGLTAPEFSVLAAYAKLALKADLEASSLAEDAWFERTLAEYFPPLVRARYPEEIRGHPLRTQIIVNEVANSVVNRGGITFVYRAVEETGATTPDIARAFVVCREVFDLTSFVADVEALDNRVPIAVQSLLYLEFRRLLDRAVRWFVRSRPGPVDVGRETARYGAAVRAQAPWVGQMLRGQERERYEQRVAELVEDAVPEALAARAASLLDQFSLLDVVDLAELTGADVDTVARVYFATSELLGIDTLLRQVAALPREDRWGALARGGLREDLYAVLAGFSRAVLTTTDADRPPQERPALWAQAHADALGQAQQSLAAIGRGVTPAIAPMFVAVRTLRNLARATGASA